MPASLLQCTPKVRVSPFQSLESIIASVSKGFETHGDVIQLTGLPARAFCFRNALHIEQILTHPQIGQTKYPRMMPRVQAVMGQGAYILSGGESWLQKRRCVKPAFAGEFTERYVGEAATLTQSMVGRWTRERLVGKPINLYDEIHRLIVEISFKIFFSVDLGDESRDLQRQTMELESQFDRISPRWLPLAGNRNFNLTCTALRERMRRIVVARRIQRSTLAADLVDVLLAADSPDEEVVDEILSIYFGASVMGVTLTWALWLMARHGWVADKLLSDSLAVSESPLKDGCHGLAFTQQFLNETTRLYPGSWGYPRYCEFDWTIDGHVIPARSLLIPMILHLHRHPAYWEEPNKFNPDRFAPPQCDARPRSAHLPFGIGQRMCTGAKLAAAIMPAILNLINRECQLELMSDEDVPMAFGFEIHPSRAIEARITRR